MMKNSNKIKGIINWWYDADTIRVIIEERRVVIRLSCIDGLEKGQPGYSQSIIFLTETFAPGTEVEMEMLGVDNFAYGREVCHVWVWIKGIKVFLNLYLVQLGWACCYPDHFSPCASMRGRFEQAESGARVLKRGMWVFDPVMPWEWRAKKNENATVRDKPLP